MLTALVPADALDGPVAVQADGVTGVSTDSCRIIRSLALDPAEATTSVAAPLDFVATARDASGDPVPDPVLSWAFNSTATAPLPGSSPPPPTTLEQGRFTPGSTGSFEIRVSAGTILATASVTVE